MIEAGGSEGLVWRSVGDGSNVVVLLHGLGTTGPYDYLFPASRSVLQELSDACFLMPDLPGHGRSRYSTVPASFSATIDAIASELSQYRQVHLVGYSFGAVMALHLAHNHNVGSLFLGGVPEDLRVDWDDGFLEFLASMRVEPGFARDLILTTTTAPIPTVATGLFMTADDHGDLNNALAETAVEVSSSPLDHVGAIYAGDFARAAAVWLKSRLVTPAGSGSASRSPAGEGFSAVEERDHLVPAAKGLHEAAEVDPGIGAEQLRGTAGMDSTTEAAPEQTGPVSTSPSRAQGRLDRLVLPLQLEVNAQLIATSALLESEPETAPETHQLVRMAIEDVQRDARLAVFDCWGLSTTIDSNVGVTVVGEHVLEALGTAAGLPARPEEVNAGLAHTYGYLFAPVETPYGFKRDRWCMGGVAAGLGLDWTVLQPFPDRHTILQNLTTCVSSVIRQFGGTTAFEPPSGVEISPEVDLVLARTQTVTEVVDEEGGLRKPALDLTIRTRVVRPSRSDQGAGYALIYTVDTGGGELLITAFDVVKDVVDDLAEAADEFTLRFNAVVPGFVGYGLQGNCSIEQ